MGAYPFLSVTPLAIQTQSPPPLSLSLSLYNSNLSLYSFFCDHTVSLLKFSKINLYFSLSPSLLSLSLLIFGLDMKFLSSSSASSSPVSFNANMCNSKSATAGCLAGVLRRLLCSGSHPTHPSDHIRDSGSVVFGKDENLRPGEKMEGVGTPGIVARLMGLDAKQEINLVCDKIKCNSIVRSRSMNSADCRSNSEAKQGRHRRVKSSSSFRETPVFFEMENDYLLLSFENEDENKELRQKERKCELGSGELGQRSTERRRNKISRRRRASEKKGGEDFDGRKNVPTRKENTDTNQPSQIVRNNGKVKEFPEQDGANLGDNKSDSPTKKEEQESGSENSSPVSVIDFGECVNDPELPASGLFPQFIFSLRYYYHKIHLRNSLYLSPSKIYVTEENLRSDGSNSKRKLSAELANYKHPSSQYASCSIGDGGEAKKIEGEGTGSGQKARQGRKFLGLWGEICQLAGAELMESNWLYKEIKKHEEFEDLGADFGLQILDGLLQELVDHL